MRSYPVKTILGVPITACTLVEIPQVCLRLLRSKGKKTFFYVNAHCLNLADKDSNYKNILQKATLVYSGGFGPVLASRILGQPLPERTPTPDFIDRIFAVAQDKKWPIYLLGANDESLRATIGILKKKFPKLVIAGYHHGYFTSGEEENVLDEINRARPKILLVGMGVSRQEKWIAQNLDKVDAEIFWAVGALFDVISGKLPRAPVWMRKLGLEWFYRLVQEPKRLWRRYTLGNLEFLGLIFRKLLSCRRARSKNG